MNEIIKRDNNKKEELKLDTDKCIKFMTGITGSYEFQLNDFCKFLKDNKLDLDAASIKKYFIYLNNSEYAVNTKNIKRQALKKVIRDMIQTIPDEVERNRQSDEIERVFTALDKNPETKAYKINNAGVTKDKYINEKEYRQLIRKVDSVIISMFIKFLWESGCRISEAIGVKLKNIKVNKGIAYITILGKGKKQRDIFITEELLKEIKKVFNGKLYLFENHSGMKYNRSYISMEIKRYAKKIIDRDNISAHALRHSFATRMIAKTNKIKAVSKFLGHSDVSITLSTYVHEELTPEDMEK